MNQVQVFGRLTKDPEMRYTQAGKPVAGFSIAVNRIGGNNEADFFDCTAWEKQAELIANSCQKGHRILIWGRLQQERWTDQQQQARTSVKIIVTGFQFIEPNPHSQQGQAQTQPPAGPPAYGQQPGYVPPAGPGWQQPPAGAPPQMPMQNPGQYNQPPVGPYWQQPPGAPPQAPGPGQYGQPPAGPYGQPATGQARPIGFGQPGQPGRGVTGVNLDDIPF